MSDVQREDVPADVSPTDDLLYEAWGVIANAHGGNWNEASDEWRGAAERWRDRWHKHLDNPEDVRWPEVDAFASLMRRELDANANKRWWPTLSPGYLLSEVISHVGKLAAAVDDDDAEAVLEHAADVANLAMMVADVTIGVPVPGRHIAGGDS